MLDNLRNFKDLHTVLCTHIIYLVTSLFPKSIDRIKLPEQRMRHVDAVPCANFNTSVHLQSGNYLINNMHSQYGNVNLIVLVQYFTFILCFRFPVAFQKQLENNAFIVIIVKSLHLYLLTSSYMIHFRILLGVNWHFILLRNNPVS